jgi:hypothetical protein
MQSLDLKIWDIYRTISILGRWKTPILSDQIIGRNCWSALASTPAQLQLGAKEAIISMETFVAFFFVSNHKSN